MAANGFANTVAENSYQYAGGDGNAIEDAPIGYYRYHFWMHDEKYKPHENWVAKSETTGPMCISLIEEQHARDGRAFVRMLVRTQFGSYKSMVLFEDDILQLVGQSSADHSSSSRSKTKKRPNRFQILGAALHMYIEHERDQIAMMEEEHGALSVRTSSSISSMASFDLARTLPSSRLYEAALCQMDADSSSSAADDGSSIHGLERRLSQVSEHNINWRSTADSSNESTKQRLRRVMRLNPFELAKKFVLVKEQDLYWALLKLEQSLQPSTAHVNVVCISDVKDASEISNWQTFCSSIGTCISAKASDCQASADFKSLQKKSPRNAEEIERRIGFVIREMVLTEARYLAVILQIERFLMRPMEERLVMNQQSYDIIFKGISNIVDVHQRFISDICGGSMGCIPDEWTGEREIEDRVDAAFGIELINFESVTNAFQRLCSSKDLLEYDQIMCYYDDRIALLVSQLQENPEVAQVVLDYERLCSQANNAFASSAVANDSCDDAVSDPGFSIAEANSHRSIKDQSMERRSSMKMLPNEELGRLSSLMDRNMGNLFQRPTRYRLMVDELLSILPDDHAFIDTWKDCSQNLRKSLAVLESHKERTDISRELFAKVVGIEGAPHSLINAKRQFVSKCTFFQVERASSITDQKLTFFLFSDVLVVARKLFSSKTRQKSGKLTDRRSSYKQADDMTMAGPKKYEFVLMVNVNDLSFHSLSTRAKSKRGKETRTYSSEMSTVDGAHHQFLLAATSHEKLSMFMEALNHRQKQLLLDSSMAQVYVASCSDQLKDSDSVSSIYYYAFKSVQDYVGGSAWKSTCKGGTLIVFLDQSASANSSCIKESLTNLLNSADHEHLTSLVVVQSMNGAYRVYVRARELIVASSNNFETSSSFTQNISSQLHHIVQNCTLLDGIYPPFGAAHQKMLQEQLNHHVAPFAKGLVNKISRFWNKFKKADTALTPEELDQQGDELTSEQFYDLADQICEMRLKDAEGLSALDDGIEATTIEPNVQSIKVSDSVPVSSLQSKPRKSVLSRVLQRMNGSLHVMD